MLVFDAVIKSCSSRMQDENDNVNTNSAFFYTNCNDTNEYEWRFFSSFIYMCPISSAQNLYVFYLCRFCCVILLGLHSVALNFCE